MNKIEEQRLEEYLIKSNIDLSKKEEIINNIKLFLSKCIENEGKRFYTAGRSENGTDCAGLPILKLCEMGFDIGDLDVKNYSKNPDGHMLVSHLNDRLERINKSDKLPGDILLMSFNNVATHIAVFLGDYYNNGEDYIIHAYFPLRKTVVHRLDDEFDKATNIAYRLHYLYN